jgi:hypothetical protein
MSDDTQVLGSWLIRAKWWDGCWKVNSRWQGTNVVWMSMKAKNRKRLPIKTGRIVVATYSTLSDM